MLLLRIGNRIFHTIAPEPVLFPAKQHLVKRDACHLMQLLSKLCLSFFAGHVESF